jgi:hypothetical protein
MYSLQHEDIAHITVQLQHNDRLCCCIDCINCTAVGGLEEVHRGNGCSYTICTLMVLQWHCVLCSTARDCCCTFRHKLLDTERCVTSNTIRMGEPNISHSSGLSLHYSSC